MAESLQKPTKKVITITRIEETYDEVNENSPKVNPPPYTEDPPDPYDDPYKPMEEKKLTGPLAEMTYEPIEKSWWEENKPDFVDDFMSLPRNSRILVIFMSVVLIGGGTAGCIIAAKGGVSLPMIGKPCPSDCTNPDHGVCDKRTGKCNCNDGFTGDTCTECQCNVIGTLNSNVTICDKSTGDCGPCKIGFYGEKCKNECQCHNKAEENICEKVTGKCEDCRMGFYGDFCEKDCNCHNGKDGNVCDQSTGVCGACEKGFFGDFCDLDCKCEDGHKENVCDKSNGKCGDCKMGLHGESCDKDCKCQGAKDGNLCEKSTGKCFNCKNGFEGDFCTFSECRCHEEGSLNLDCDQTDGKCTCSDGWMGLHCEYQKNVLLIADQTREIEFLQIADNPMVCNKLPPLNVGSFNEIVGGLLNYEKPVICDPSNQKCFDITENGIEPKSAMGLEEGSASVNINRNQFYISGENSDNITIYSIDKEPKRSEIRLPFKPSHHCMVQFDEQYFMLIGYDRSSRRNRHRIFDLVAKTWQPAGQDGKFPKGGAIANQLFCGAFKANGKTTIFLSGHGYNTFLYDVASRKWTNGPNLPKQVSQYQIIANPMGDGILILGGKKTFEGLLDEINELKCNPECKWNTNYGHKLPSPRTGFIAFYVPNKNLPCGSSLT